MRPYTLLLLFFLHAINIRAQSPRIDSLSNLLLTEQEDSNRVTLLWQLAQQYQSFKPDTSLLLSEEALLLSRRIQFTEGESRSLALLATSQYLLGDYPKALTNYMLKLKIEEKRNSPRNFASALNNIGLMYILLAEYPQALSYLYRADSTVEAARGVAKEELKYSITNNIGETYMRMKNPDSADRYFRNALQLAQQSGDSYSLGESMVGLANVFSLKQQGAEASRYYHLAVPHLIEVLNNDLLCEAYLGIAKIYDGLSYKDSAAYYGNRSYQVAKNDGFLSRQLDAAIFLSQHYKKLFVYDSAFRFMELSVSLKDSVMGNEKVREAMVISTNEQLRQADMAEQRRKDKAIRYQQLQLLLIAIFIPLFFLLTLFVSRIKIHVHFIRFMGIISLLMLFEYLTLLLHPMVADFTHHRPVLELLIFMAIGAGLIPLHHKLEHWLIAKLIRDRHHLQEHSHKPGEGQKKK
jgi:tetratricopeptide (TPR) repeat protein